MDAMAEGRMDRTADGSHGGYEPPALSIIGSVAELTLGCDKTWGSSDGFTFQGNDIACASP
jgi:hypothetical protein